MRSAVLWILVPFCLCFTAVSAGKRDSSSSSYYTKPKCADEQGFYCKSSTSASYSCRPRTERCTTDDASDQCPSKIYKNCNYNQASGKFAIIVSAAVLEKGEYLPYIGQSESTEHRFVTYRGLMYEYGGYGSRVQDPLDPNYEYKKRPIKRTYPDGSSTCTYEQVRPYLKFWKSGDYQAISIPFIKESHNCQDFVHGLTDYLHSNCARLSKYRKRSDDELDDELALYFFNLSIIDCTTSDSYSPESTTLYSSASTNEKTLIALAAVMIVGLAIW